MLDVLRNFEDKENIQVYGMQLFDELIAYSDDSNFDLLIFENQELLDFFEQQVLSKNEKIASIYQQLLDDLHHTEDDWAAK